jgi:hypothetical protein
MQQRQSSSRMHLPTDVAKAFALCCPGPHAQANHDAACGVDIDMHFTLDTTRHAQIRAIRDGVQMVNARTAAGTADAHSLTHSLIDQDSGAVRNARIENLPLSSIVTRVPPTNKERKKCLCDEKKKRVLVKITISMPICGSLAQA